jgi:hypothetical protein
LTLAGDPLALGFSTPPLVTSVAVLGANLRVDLATQVGQPYNDKLIEKDVRDLWKAALCDDIRVETAQRDGGTAVVFRVAPSPDLRLQDIRVEPSSYGLPLMVPEGTPINRMRAHEIAGEARRQLVAQGYTGVQVDWDLAPLAGKKVTLRLMVKAGEPVYVNDVEFAGDLGIDSKELRGALRALRPRRIIPPIPGLWGGWRLLPAYSPEAVDSDLGRLRSLYLSKGYFDARVHLDEIAIRRATAHVRVLAQAGPLYHVREGLFQSHDLCTNLFAQRREAEREGILDFNVRLDIRRIEGGSNSNPLADLDTKVARGGPYRVGQINFIRSHHHNDAAIRRNLVLDEGGVLDPRLLRKSLARLNQTNRFEPVDDRNVVIDRNENTGEANVSIRLTDRKRGSWSLSGPAGPMSIAGPLQASISSRLPARGAGLFDLSAYIASFSLLAFAHPILPLLSITSKASGILPVFALQRPFSPGEGWKSGFLIAPQLGWRATAVSYGATQIQQRLLPLLAGDRGLTKELPVTVVTAAGEGVMYCEPPSPSLSPLRTGAALGLRLLGGI